MQAPFTFGAQSGSGFQSTTSLAPAVDLSRSSAGGFGTRPLGGSELGLSQLSTSKGSFGFGIQSSFQNPGTAQAQALVINGNEVPPSKMALSKLKQLFKELAEVTAQHITTFTTHYQTMYDIDVGIHRLRDEIKATKRRVEGISSSQFQALKQLQSLVTGAEAVDTSLSDSEKKNKTPKNQQMLFALLSNRIDIFREELDELIKHFPGGVDVADILCTVSEQRDLCTWMHQFISP